MAVADGLQARRLGGRVAGALLWLLLLGGCSAGRDFVRPEAPAVTGYTAEPLARTTAHAPVALGEPQRFRVGEPAGARWWSAFGSAQLEAWIDRALQNSPTVEAAAATLREARHAYEARAGSTRYPRAAAGLDARRTHASGAQPAPDRVGNLFGASVQVTYDLDLAGGERRALEALGAQVREQAFRLQAARLELAGEVAMAAITQAQLWAQLQAQERALEAQRQQLEATLRREELGAASRDDVLALGLRVEQTRAAIPALRTRLERTDHLLARLAGQLPGEGPVPRFTLEEFTLPREVPLAIPSELVRARPDIRAAEALLHAATAQHGVAVAKMYPRLSIGAELGTQALSAGSLFGPGSLMWGLAAQVAQPLLDAGLPSQARAAQAAADAAAAHYRGTLVQAFAEVADVLRAMHNDAQALRARAATDGAARALVESTRLRYLAGAAAYVEWLEAERQAQDARVGLVEAQARRLIDTVIFYQAMGGGTAGDA